MTSALPGLAAASLIIFMIYMIQASSPPRKNMWIFPAFFISGFFSMVPRSRYF